MENLAKVERTTLTMRETAEYLGISYWLVNQLVRRREKFFISISVELRRAFVRRIKVHFELSFILSRITSTSSATGKESSSV